MISRQAGPRMKNRQSRMIRGCWLLFQPHLSSPQRRRFSGSPLLLCLACCVTFNLAIAINLFVFTFRLELRSSGRITGCISWSISPRSKCSSLPSKIRDDIVAFYLIIMKFLNGRRLERGRQMGLKRWREEKSSAAEERDGKCEWPCTKE